MNKRPFSMQVDLDMFTPASDKEKEYLVKMRPSSTFFKDGVKLGFTVDERIADGYYFSKSIKMLKLFLEQPELLDLPLNEKLSDELWAKINMK